MSPSSTIEQVKKLFSQKINFPEKEIEFIFDNTLSLNDQQTLNDYSIKHCDAIKIISKNKFSKSSKRIYITI
jgi:hypothetical protein